MAENQTAVKSRAVKTAQDADVPQELKVKVESLRCVNCGRFLLYYAVIEGTIATKCRRCHVWNAVDITSTIVVDPIDNGQKPCVE